MGDPDNDLSNTVLNQCKICHKRYAKSTDELCDDDYGELVPIGEDPLIGTYFDKKYEIISFIREGGMSLVYKARHRYMDRIVAIKLLLTNQAQDPEERLLAQRRFERESKAASAIAHPNVVTVHDFGFSSNGQAYLVMDYLGGNSLADILDAKQKIEVHDAIPIFTQICEGLDAVHGAGLVHRDLKPGNVVLTKRADGSDLVKIVDFGIVLFQGGEDKAAAVRLTATGHVYGTASYMSPEQCLSKPIDARSDIYAMGCLMYEVLTGRLVFSGDSFGTLAVQHSTEAPAPFGASSPPLLTVVEKAVMKCLAKAPEDRFQTMRQLQESLSAAALDERAKPEALARRRRQLIAIVSVGAAMVLFMSGIIWLLAFWHGPKGDSGTLLSQAKWQIDMQLARQALDRKEYSKAITLLNEAKDLSLDFDTRTMRLAALSLLADAYLKSGNQKEHRKTTKAIEIVVQSQALIDFEDMMAELKELLSKKTALTEEKCDALADRVSSAAEKLESLRLEREAETLLWKAIETYQKLNVQPKDHIAEFDNAMAECLHKQQRWPEIRWYLNDALQIRNAAVLYRSTPESLKEQVEAYLKIGQFDRDVSNFKESELELKKALELADREFAGNNSLVSECINSYAELLRQMGRMDEYKKLIARSDSLWYRQEKSLQGSN